MEMNTVAEGWDYGLYSIESRQSSFSINSYNVLTLLVVMVLVSCLVLAKHF